MSRATRFLTLLAVLFGSFAGRVGATPANKPAAEALFEDGRRLLGAGRVAEACGKFEASQELDSGVGTLLFLGDCSEQLGRFASAWAAFMEAASLARARGDAVRESVAATRAQALRAKVPRLLVRVPEAHRVPLLRISIGGQAISEASWNAAIPVDPGPQRLEASAPGRERWVGVVEMAKPGQERSVVVPRLEPESGPALRPRSERTPERSPGRSVSSGRVIGIVAASAGAAAVAVGSVLGLSARAKNEQSRDFCPRLETLCTEQGKELRDEARGQARASTAAFVAGGALVATGIVLIVMSPGADSERQKDGEPAKQAGMMRLTLGGRSGGLELKGHF